MILITFKGELRSFRMITKFRSNVMDWCIGNVDEGVS